MKRLIPLMGFMAALALVGCQNTQVTSSSTSPSTPESSEKEQKGPFNVLFIGNSFTFRNDVDLVFKSIVEAKGYQVSVDSVTASSYTLAKFNDPSDAYGSIVSKKLNENKYDYVFLQEQSTRPINGNAKYFFNAVRTLVSRIREKGAEPILYETWGYDDKHQTAATYGGHDEMTIRLAAHYEAIGEELNVKVSKAGQAFNEIYNKYRNTINLYHTDYFHPSSYGTFLAAACHFQTIFNEKSEGAPYVSFNKGTGDSHGTALMPDLDDTNTKYLHKAAYNATFVNKNFVPAEKKIDSKSIK